MLLPTALFLAGAFFIEKNNYFMHDWSKIACRRQKNIENVSKKLTFPNVLVQNCKNKLRLRGWDLYGEIRAEILRRLVLILCQMVGWRPNWCQKGVILGLLGFRARLAHPWALGPKWPWGPQGLFTTFKQIKILAGRPPGIFMFLCFPTCRKKGPLGPWGGPGGPGPP